MQDTEVYVSITGLELRRLWHYPTFMFHAVRSMGQARSAPGNLGADARTIDGIHHTLSIGATGRQCAPISEAARIWRR
jgi:hypothetical protein